MLVLCFFLFVEMTALLCYIHVKQMSANTVWLPSMCLVKITNRPTSVSMSLPFPSKIYKLTLHQNSQSDQHQSDNCKCLHDYEYSFWKEISTKFILTKYDEKLILKNAMGVHSLNYHHTNNFHY